MRREPEGGRECGEHQRGGDDPCRIERHLPMAYGPVDQHAFAQDQEPRNSEKPAHPRRKPGSPSMERRIHATTIRQVTSSTAHRLAFLPSNRLLASSQTAVELDHLTSYRCLKASRPTPQIATGALTTAVLEPAVNPVHQAGVFQPNDSCLRDRLFGTVPPPPGPSHCHFRPRVF